jgi:ribosomal protein L37E
MKREDLRGQTFGWDGKKIIGYCKECGEFTLNVDTVLCASCSLLGFLKKFNASVCNNIKTNQQ